MTEKYDWTNFKKQTIINAAPEEVYDAWAKPGEITKWFLAQADYTTPEGRRRDPQEAVGPGDQYYWRWLQNADLEGEILAVDPGKMVEFTFGEKEPGSDERMIVTVQVSELDDQATLLEIRQRNLVDTLEAHADHHLSCHLGWEFYSTNLKAFLEYGIDLREHSPERAKILRA